MKKRILILAAVCVLLGLLSAAAVTLLRGTDLGDLTVTGVVLPVNYGDSGYGRLEVSFRAPDGVTLTAGSDTCTVTVKDGDTVVSETTAPVRAAGGGYKAVTQLADTGVDVSGLSVFLSVKKGSGFYDAPQGVTIPGKSDTEVIRPLQPGDTVEVAKEMTLAEVKPRYGIEKKITASGVIGKASYIDGMDAYMAQIPYAKNTGGAFTLAENFSANSSVGTQMYVTFTCVLPGSEPQVQNALSKLKLLVTYDGKTYSDSGVSFTVEKTGEKAATADGAGGMNQEFDVYRFTSGKIALNSRTIKNIKIVPQEGYTTTTSTVYFRLLSLYVWADTGEKVSVPVLDGFDVSVPVTKTTTNGVTTYKLYSTKFADTNGWTTNCISYAQGSGVRYQNVLRPYTYFKMEETALATTDGGAMRLYSPNMKLDPSLYDELWVELAYFNITANKDPAFELRLGYSTDNGNTWTKITTAPTVTQVTTGAVTLAGATYQAKLNIKPLLPANKIVTNVVILPYNEKCWYTVTDPTNGELGTTPVRTQGEMYKADGSFRMLDFSISGKSSDSALAVEAIPVSVRHYDSLVIQKMIDDAKAAGKKEVTIPGLNPRTGTDTWTISKTILVPSDMTLYLNNCTLRWENYVLCRMMQNAGAGENKTAADEDQNIHIIGVGDAVMQGGLYNGLTTPLISGTGRSTWDNIMLLLHNVNNFSVKNIRIEESRFWGVAMLYCRNGSVEHMDYFDSRKVYLGLQQREQDGVDVRNGCENIVVNDITGRTGDDSVALNAIRPLGYKVGDKHDDIKNITVTNVNTRLVHWRMQVRLTAANTYKIHDVLIDGVYDTREDFGNELCSTATVRIGDNNASYASESQMSVGDIDGIYIRNVRGSTEGYGAIDIHHENVEEDNWAYEVETCANTYESTEKTGVLTYDVGGSSKLIWNKCSHSWTQKVGGEHRLVSAATCSSGAVYKLDCSKCPAVSSSQTYTNSTATGPHVGGTATCTKLALCSACGTAYGSYLAPESCTHDGELTLTKVRFNNTAKDQLMGYINAPFSAAAKEWTYSAIVLDSSGNVLAQSANTAVPGGREIGPATTTSYVACAYGAAGKTGLEVGHTVTVIAEVTDTATGKVYGVQGTMQIVD